MMVAVDHFAKCGGRVEEVGLCLPRYEGANDDLLFGASPDGLIIDGDGERWALEVKCHCPFIVAKGKDAKVDGRRRFVISDRPAPREVMPWVLPQLMLETYSVGER